MHDGVMASRSSAHYTKKEKTRSITYRLPVNLIEELETESAQKGISHNVLVRQVLGKYISWDRFSHKIGMIPVPKKILDSLGSDLDGKDIDKIIKIIVPMIRDDVMLIKGKYDLKRCIETLEDYMRVSGMKSDHRVEGDVHSFIVQHELGAKWSIFVEHLLAELFHDFLPDVDLKFQTTPSTVIMSIALGKDFDEHQY